MGSNESVKLGILHKNLCNKYVYSGKAVGGDRRGVLLGKRGLKSC